MFEPEMMKKNVSRDYIVVNAPVLFTLYATLRAWATMEAGDDTQAGHPLVYLAAACNIDIIRRVKHRQLTTASAKPMSLRALQLG